MWCTLPFTLICNIWIICVHFRISCDLVISSYFAFKQIWCACDLCVLTEICVQSPSTAAFSCQVSEYFTPRVRPAPLSPSTSSVSVASCISEWEQRTPQANRQGSPSPPHGRSRVQGLPESLGRRRGRLWARDCEMPVQPADVDLEESGYRVSDVACCSCR